LNNNRYRILVIFFALPFVYFPGSCQYKILEDNDAVFKVHQAIDSIYNLNFEAADVIIEDLENTLGDYPGVLLLRGFYINWKYRPIKKEHDSYKLFESYLLKGIEKSEEMLKEDELKVEASFFLMACHGYLAELYVNNGQNFSALGEAKSAYKYIKFGFDYTDVNPEFYFSSGIYNYYREKYPQENSFYKSFLWFFRSGDMEEGLKQLKKGSVEAVFTQAECYSYLFHINLRYEDKPENAMYYAKILLEKYPKNLHYVSNFIENKIRLNQYEGLLVHINKLLQSERTYYKYLGEIFYGIYLEMYEKDNSAALDHYKKADTLGQQDEVRIPHYDSMLYLGLGRINQSSGNIQLGNQYLKKSVKAAEYKAYRKDAEELLNN